MTEAVETSPDMPPDNGAEFRNASHHKMGVAAQVHASLTGLMNQGQDIAVVAAIEGKKAVVETMANDAAGERLPRLEEIFTQAFRGAVAEARAEGLI